MSYSKTLWVNGEAPPINATNLNKIEDGISTNEEEIIKLKGSMKFMGTTSTEPSEPEVGQVWQASVANIVSNNSKGDLLVRVDNNSWHIIPSGDEPKGTVTYLEAGEGISFGQAGLNTITETGTISLNTSFLASENRNGLFSSELFHKLSTLNQIAVDGDWSNLNNIPISARRPIVSDLGNHDGIDGAEAVVSQTGLKTLFNTKANTTHTHLFEDIKEESSDNSKTIKDYLATSSDGVSVDAITKAAAINHSHGNITSTGYFLNNDTLAKNQWLKTASNGLITSAETISSTDIRGYTFYNADKSASINLGTLDTNIETNAENITAVTERVDTLETNFGKNSSSGVWGKVANLVSVVGSTASSGLRKTVASHTTQLSKLSFRFTGSESNDKERVSLTVPAKSNSKGRMYLEVPDGFSVSTIQPFALRGWNFSNQPKTGRNASLCTLYGVWFAKEKTTKGNDAWYAHYEIRNDAATSAIIYLTLYITWKAT